MASKIKKRKQWIYKSPHTYTRSHKYVDCLFNDGMVGLGWTDAVGDSIEGILGLNEAIQVENKRVSDVQKSTLL